MPILELTPLTMYRGEHVVWTFTVTQNGSALDLTGATVRFTVRSSFPVGSIVADTDAVLTKYSPSNGVTLTNPSGGLFEVEIVKADTNSLSLAGGPLVCTYGVEFTPSGSSEPRSIGQGSFTIQPDVVRAI